MCKGSVARETRRHKEEARVGWARSKVVGATLHTVLR